jgi:hypothetical protein
MKKISSATTMDGKEKSNSERISQIIRGANE